MTEPPRPTERELQILKVLWERGEASVREVYEDLREKVPIVQNTVQAFLRTMEEKGLVAHRTDGRSFIYKPLLGRKQAAERLVSGLLERVFDGALDQFVASAFSLRWPSAAEISRLEELLRDYKRRQRGGHPRSREGRKRS